MNSHTTFRQLESPRDANPNANVGGSPLEIWYRSVRDKPISQFTYNDLCKACRQGLYPEVMVPVAIENLRKEPLAGESYDGELIVAMKSVDSNFWLAHASLALEVASIAKFITEQVEPELRSKLAALTTLPRVEIPEP